MEVWNNVFSQFNNDGHNHYTDLIQKNIGYRYGSWTSGCCCPGCGFYFLMWIQFRHCATKSAIWQVKYLEKHETDVSIRIITDHIRSVTFMISRWYHAINEVAVATLTVVWSDVRHVTERCYGIDGLFLAKIIKTVIDDIKDGYRNWKRRKEFIF